MPNDPKEPLGDPPAGLETRGSIARLASVFLIVVVVAGLFAYAGGWLTPHRLTPSRMIDAFEKVDGPHPGFRRNHAKGLCFSGTFESNGQGAALSKAVVFTAGRVPVIGRFSLGGGQPYQVDAPHTARAMAILFKLPNGEEWRTGMVNLPVLPVSTPQAFHDLILASAPDPATGKPDPSKMSAFLAKYPGTVNALHLIGGAPVSSGFDNSRFNSLDAFRFISADGKVTPIRWSMVPVQPFEPLSPTQPPPSDKNYLFDALIASVHQHPLQWRLVITVGEPGDPTDNASLPWPNERQQIDVGTLTIDHVESEDTSPTRDINFDPLVLPNGIAPSDDPLLSARSAAYSQSFRRREGEEKEPSAVSTAEANQ
jgi:catalase